MATSRYWSRKRINSGYRKTGITIERSLYCGGQAIVIGIKVEIFANPATSGLREGRRLEAYVVQVEDGWL
jgi:hypothetical protein